MAKKGTGKNSYLNNSPSLDEPSLSCGIFKEQQTTLVLCLVLHDVALKVLKISTHVVLVLVDYQAPLVPLTTSY